VSSTSGKRPKKLDVEPRNASAASTRFARQVGALVRSGRARRGITRRQLAEESGISERYLAQLEGGEGNPSIIVLKAIADALEVAVVELLPLSGARDRTLHRVIDLAARLPAQELAEIADAIEQRLQGPINERAQRIALVGLRGAGKSTLGRLLAQAIGAPFVELNRLIEQEYGASIAMLIELSGVKTFRRYERASLEKVIAENERVVIATPGGIVSNRETYALLLRRTHTVWLTARPQDHMQRVMEQGDFRPMAENREAMNDLIAILEARGDDYAKAEARLDTSPDTAERSLAKLLALVRPWLPEPFAA
jgi:XRE family aerobic/anaerobic benzoate catabolism transcriptional regulator